MKVGMHFDGNADTPSAEWRKCGPYRKKWPLSWSKCLFDFSTHVVRLDLQGIVHEFTWDDKSKIPWEIGFGVANHRHLIQAHVEAWRLHSSSFEHAPRNFIEQLQETDEAENLRSDTGYWVWLENGLHESDNSGKWVCGALCVALTFDALSNALIEKEFPNYSHIFPL